MHWLVEMRPSPSEGEKFRGFAGTTRPTAVESFGLLGSLDLLWRLRPVGVRTTKEGFALWVARGIGRVCPLPDMNSSQPMPVLYSGTLVSSAPTLTGNGLVGL
ncbi:hypothetical protein D2E25_1317 [Bifidobacterium goeldii]|uniref:Uncharacterized protein n=1 Tax=Bifidobacterium goeldii TaxID=2306975 RepID=A0A430FIT1_9BIFI|nr:hypothetical protein D2E25_1317 [Bifidobacterium goeldii]